MTGSFPESVAERAQSTAMEEAILGQPEAISRAITANLDAIRTASALLAAARRVRLCGVGASHHAAMAGEHLLRSIGIDARAANAFDLAMYPTSFDPGDLVIVFTHRGGKNYTTRALARAVQSGLKAIVIAGEDADVSGADVVISTVPQERSAVHTVSFTAALAVLAAAAARCEPRSALATALPSLPEAARGMLASRDTAREVAQVACSSDRRTLVTGAGAMHPIARGGALAVKETAYLVIEGNHIEDALHGGLQALNPGDLIVQLAPDGPSDERNADLARISGIIGFERWRIGGMRDGARWHSPLPEVPEIVAPILTTIPLQWLALECALARGTDPDSFRRDDERFDAAFATLTN